MAAASVVLMLTSTVYAVWQIAHGGLEAGDKASVLAVPLAAAALAVAIVQLRKPVEGNDADLASVGARTLAGHVAAGEGVVRRQLLGNDVQRINLHYQLQTAPARAAQAPAAGRTFADGAASLPDITAYYRATRPARLVITGAAGAGKTVLALELLLSLIADRGDHDPVPVRVPLAQWDTSTPLRTLLIQRLTDAYKWPDILAANIVDHGLVLPVLDGLDEMDPTLPDGTPDPDAPRARAALEQLNSYQDKDGRHAAPLILTCRTAHYDALPRTDTLIDAARVTIAPIDTTVAAAYLAARARDTQRWQPLLHHMTTDAASPAALLLSTPWRLCLTATVYHRTGDPADLLHHTTQADLEHHLLARYIPAATDTTDNPRRYDAADVHRWLHHLTTHLTPAANNPAPGTDLALHRLWSLAGRTRVRGTTTLFTTVICLLPLALAWSTSSTLATELIIGVAALTGLSAVVQGPEQPVRLNMKHLRTSRGRREATGWGALGLSSGVTTVPLLVLIAVLTRQPREAAMPRLSIREDATAGLTVGLAAGLAAAGFITTFGLTVEAWLAVGLAVGLAAGLRISAAWRYVVFLMCSRGRLPFGLARFLDWACTAGLMRYSGSAYQFRHRELQQWLTAHPDPVIRPAVPSRP